MSAPREQAEHRGEIAAGAVAGNRDAVGIDAEFVRRALHEGERCAAILDGRREFVFRRQPVVGGDDDAGRRVGEPAADLVMRVEIADHPAAAMQIEQRRSAGRCRALPAIDPERQRAAGSGDDALAERCDRFALALQVGKAFIVGAARLLRRSRFERRRAGLAAEFEHMPGLRIEGRQGRSGMASRTNLPQASRLAASSSPSSGGCSTVPLTATEPRLSPEARIASMISSTCSASSPEARGFLPVGQRARQIGDAEHAVVGAVGRGIGPVAGAVEFALAGEIGPVGAALRQRDGAAERVGIGQPQRAFGAVQFDRVVGVLEHVPGGAEGDGGAGTEFEQRQDVGRRADLEASCS